ncbi:MAG: aldo/keto reductase [Pseudomonadota bacterium]
MIGRRKFLQLTGATALTSAVSPQSFAKSHASIATREIPSTGERVGVIGFGNSPAFSDDASGEFAQEYGARRGEAVRELVEAFRVRGGNLIDASYGSIVNLSEYLPREELDAICFVTSPFNVFGEHVATREHVEKLISILRKNPLDTLQLRNAFTPDTTKAYWPLMKEWKAEGLVRHIGPSGGGPNHADVMVEVMNDGADFVHVDYSLFSQHAEEVVLPAALETGTAVFVMQPFRSGEIFRLTAGRELPDWVSEFDCESWAQFALKWIVGHPAITSVFMETTKTRHVVDNMGAGIGRLPDADQRQRMLELIQSWS